MAIWTPFLICGALIWNEIRRHDSVGWFLMSPWATYLERWHGCWSRSCWTLYQKIFWLALLHTTLYEIRNPGMCWCGSGSHPQLLFVLLQTVRDELDVVPGLICRVYEVADADMVEQAYNKNWWKARCMTCTQCIAHEDCFFLLRLIPIVSKLTITGEALGSSFMVIWTQF